MLTFIPVIASVVPRRSEAFVFIVVDVLDLFRAVVDLGENDLGAACVRREPFKNRGHADRSPDPGAPDAGTGSDFPKMHRVRRKA